MKRVIEGLEAFPNFCFTDYLFKDKRGESLNLQTNMSHPPRTLNDPSLYDFIYLCLRQGLVSPTNYKDLRIKLGFNFLFGL